MERITTLPWPLVIGLGVFALIRPIMSIVGLMEELGKPLAPLLVTLGVSLVWILVVGLSRVREPVLTLVFAGLVYAVCAIVLSAVLSPILTGDLQGPLARPYAILPVLLVNVIWGAVTGALALLVQRLRRLLR